MISFKILTLFPKIFDGFIKNSIIHKLIVEKKIKIELIDFREYSKNKYKKVDDYQYGGGPGMLLQIEPIVEALKKNKTKNSYVILLTPQGKTFSQKEALNFSKKKEIILICGRYEGFDERIINYVDQEISIGDYILNGGEIPSMVLVESISRLIENAINKESLHNESFENNLLDYPMYAKPLSFDGHEVPKILLSGNHKKINEYRLNAQIEKTKKNRPDLYNIYKKCKDKNEN